MVRVIYDLQYFFVFVPRPSVLVFLCYKISCDLNSYFLLRLHQVAPLVFCFSHVFIFDSSLRTQLTYIRQVPILYLPTYSQVGYFILNQTITFFFSANYLRLIAVPIRDCIYDQVHDIVSILPTYLYRSIFSS